MKTTYYPSALTIAGSDSGGGAGIQADLRTFNALGVFGCSAICAVTGQNPLRVDRIDALPAEAVVSQIDAVLTAFPIRFAKSGMLFSAPIIRAVSQAVEKYRLSLICDPVMVATSGARLLEKDAIDALRDELLPRAAWITPNIPEAELLLGEKLPTPDDQLRGARLLAETFGVSVLLKGGHLIRSGRVVDFVVHGGKSYRLSSPEADASGHAGHGTGCTLSAAITASLALGMPWKKALCEAKSFVFGSLAESVVLGDGIRAMYPPTIDTFEEISLEEIK
ncbi:MAG: bifunctional hydroxymethylpyrimidine kinase/phosphomethylpyrimidine kinase [Victivallaceae bacterium]|nr:bifunctional hydroxymethylpyrimidine kinase/phosphomethylpyrimidine kinase [Victivallaceae bacterium]